MSKITLQHESTTVSVEAKSLTLDDVLEELVKPALLAVGFNAGSVNRIVLEGSKDASTDER